MICKSNREFRAVAKVYMTCNIDRKLQLLRLPELGDFDITVLVLLVAFVGVFGLHYDKISLHVGFGR